ncbi:MAG: hypothetical protein Q7S31_04070 [bacterium]|nr:hypothetical protein [bacterium]
MIESPRVLTVESLLEMFAGDQRSKDYGYLFEHFSEELTVPAILGMFANEETFEGKKGSESWRETAQVTRNDRGDIIYVVPYTTKYIEVL